jgi:hypothetical protein
VGFDDDELRNLLELRRSGGRLSIVQMRALADSPDLRNEARAELHAEIAQHEGADPELPSQPFTEAEGAYARSEKASARERGLDERTARGGLGQSDWFKRLKQFSRR